MSYSKFLTERKKACLLLLEALSKDYSYVSILGNHIVAKQKVTDKQNTMVQDDEECGFVIKLFNGQHYSEYSCDDIQEDHIDDLVHHIKSVITLPAGLDQHLVQIDAIKEEPLKKVFIRENEGATLDEETILASLQTIKDKAFAYSDKIINAYARFSSRHTSKMFLSKEKDLEQYYTWTNVMMNITAKDGDKIKAAYSPIAYANESKALQEAIDTVEDTAQEAIDLLDACPLVPGVYDVICDPSISGLIAHEAFGHGVEMDMFVKNRALAKDYMNQYVASELVSMKDGAASTMSAASYFFDDDGVLAQDTLIIENGILKSGISDALSALQLNTQPTGNGRRESYKRKAYSRMTNTFFCPGHDRLEDMIQSIKHGYLICQTSNGMEDPKNWQIQCVAAYGREIKDGQFTGKIVSPVVISGYVPDVLKSISMVSDASTFKVIGSGSCGKGHKEWVHVSDGGPYMKVKVKLG